MASYIAEDVHEAAASDEAADIQSGEAVRRTRPRVVKLYRIAETASKADERKAFKELIAYGEYLRSVLTRRRKQEMLLRSIIHNLMLGTAKTEHRD